MKLYILSVFTFVIFVEGTGIQKTLHDGNNHFTAKMFAEVVKNNPRKSVVMSAFSVITPLSQLAVASEGPSHDELVAAVGFPDDIATTNAVFALINEKFNSTEGVELRQASKFYIPLGYEVHSEFASVSQNIYHSEIANINFGDSQSAAREINVWVENQTNNRIKDLVDANSLTGNTRGVLVNALYFKGAWKYPFLKSVTREQDFYINKDTTIQIPLMHHTQDYLYRESGKLNSKILELPYTGDQCSFVIILPNDIEGIGQLLQKLSDPAILDEEMSDMRKVEVRVTMPKFRIETTTDLKEILMKLNIAKIFSEEANLTKLLKTDETLYVSDAVQKAFIEVNEEGAEAAAANAFGFAVATSLFQPQIYNFVADHPFAYHLKAHDEIIFSGVFYGR